MIASFLRRLLGRDVEIAKAAPFSFDDLDPEVAAELPILEQEHPGVIDVVARIESEYPGAVDALVKARKATRVEPKAWEIDPLDVSLTTGADYATDWHQGTMGLTFETLRAMARVPVIGAIIQTRINQIAEFAVPQPNPYATGFQIVLRDPEKKATRAVKKKAREIEQWLLTCGDPEVSRGWTFEACIRALVRDSLSYDQGCMEVVWTRGGKIVAFIPVDATTIRRAKPTAEDLARGVYGKQSDRYVQWINQQSRAEWDGHEMLFGIRRPRTWLVTNNYGFPELEELMRVVTNILGAETYNSNNFRHGVHAKGVLALKAKLSPQLWRAFRREFYSLLSGSGGANRMPMIKLDPDNKEELQHISFQNNNKDMEFSSWVSWLLKVATSLYGMDPAEVNFVYGNEGQASTLSQRGPGERIQASKERGLRPLLRSVEGWLNTMLVHRLDEDFTLRFIGLDTVSEAERLDLDTKAVQHIETINEVRARRDLPPLKNPIADIGPMDPQYVAMASQYIDPPDDGGGEQGGEPGGGGGEQGEGEGDGGDEGGFDFDSWLNSADGGEDDQEAGEQEATEDQEATAKALTTPRSPGIRSVTVEVAP